MSGTQSVLDQMTQAITQRKGEKAATLTPVGTEKGGPLSGPRGVQIEAPFPFDFPYQDMAQSIRILRQAANHVLEACDHMEAALEHKETPEVVCVRPGFAETPAPEVAEAIEPAPVPQPEEPAREEQPSPSFTGVTIEWSCPSHGIRFVEQRTSRRGRTYAICVKPGCQNFEK